MPLTETTREECREIIARYPDSRSALGPMLHLVQSEEGYVSPDGIALCAEELGLTTAEVASVATFYTMYKRRPVGEHHIGICVNPQCGLLGGNELWKQLTDSLGIGHNETTPDGKISIEHIECQAACSNAPSTTVDWEFMDDMTPEKLRDVVERLQNGEEVISTRGPAIRSFCATERTIAGFDDGLAHAGGNCADEQMLAGLTVAKERGMIGAETNANPDKASDPAANGSARKGDK